MNWILLVPAGTLVHHIEADVAEPVVLSADDHEAAAKKIRLLALEAEMRALRADLGEPDLEPPNSPVANRQTGPQRATPVASREPEPHMPQGSTPGTFVGADGVARTELHHTERRPGPRHLCPCGAAFYDPTAHRIHLETCATGREVVTMRGQSVQRVHGAAVRQFGLD